MTEAEWLTCDNPTRMKVVLRGRASERKLRLLGCGCCRVVWDRITDDRNRRAVGVVERYADGIASRASMAVAERESSAASGFAFGSAGTTPARHRSRRAGCTSWAVHLLTYIPPGSEQVVGVLEYLIDALEWLKKAEQGSVRATRAGQANLVRCVFGNPFRPVTAELSWFTAPVVSLARSMYESRDFTAMPVLADALEEAGCDNADILSHCRGPGPHVRGCWVVDLALGKI